MFIIVVKGSYHVEGDERSRTNPGHGYPAHTVDTQTAIIVDTMAEVEQWAEANRTESFRVFQGNEFEVVKKVQFVMKPVKR